MMKMRIRFYMSHKLKLVFISILVLVSYFAFPQNSQAACILNNAAWGGPIKTGQVVNLFVSGTGCNGNVVSINIYKDTAIDFHIKTADSLTFTSDTQALGQVVISDADFQKVYDSRSTIDVYFQANAGDSEKKSNSISLSCTLSPTGVCGGAPNPNTPGSPGSPGTPGQPIPYTFKLENPFKGASDLMGLIKVIGQWIFNLAIPVAVIFIIVGGLQFLFAGANPALAQKGKTTLKYAIIGLAIVLIGQGFVTLIKSVIELGGTNQAPTQNQPQ